jgi:hypothetical protein
MGLATPQGMQDQEGDSGHRGVGSGEHSRGDAGSEKACQRAGALLSESLSARTRCRANGMDDRVASRSPGSEGPATPNARAESVAPQEAFFSQIRSRRMTLEIRKEFRGVDGEPLEVREREAGCDTGCLVYAVFRGEEQLSEWTFCEDEAQGELADIEAQAKPE